jgi:hypothetical protein
MPFGRKVWKNTSKVIGVLNKCRTPAAIILKASTNYLGVVKAGLGVVKAGANYLGGRQQNSAAMNRGPQNSAAMASMSSQFNNSFDQVVGELRAIEHQLADQRVDIEQILEVVTDLKYKAGIEKIEAAYRVLLKGWHNRKKTLEKLGSFIYELDTLKEQHLNMKKVRDYLALVQRRKGEEAAKQLGSYVITVKAEYLLIVTLYYTYDEDHERVLEEYDDFNRDAMEIIEYVGLADIYEEDTRDELYHLGRGKKVSIYKEVALSEGEWRAYHGSRLF